MLRPGHQMLMAQLVTQPWYWHANPQPTCQIQTLGGGDLQPHRYCMQNPLCIRLSIPRLVTMAIYSLTDHITDSSMSKLPVLWFESSLS